MPFTFKLSQRLARIKAASLLLPAAALVIASCDLRPRGSGTGVDNPVTQVFVYPDSLILDPLQSYQFHVFGRTQAGDSVTVSVRWSASAGLITSSGMYTADTSANDVLVTAMLTTSTTSGTSNVKKRRLIQIVINPATSSVLTGAMQQFTAYGRRNTGDSVSVSVTYSATGGIISGSGAYTAGQTPGAYQVTAKQNGGSLTDTAAVTVASAPPPRRPGELRHSLSRGYDQLGLGAQHHAGHMSGAGERDGDRREAELHGAGSLVGYRLSIPADRVPGHAERERGVRPALQRGERDDHRFDHTAAPTAAAAAAPTHNGIRRGLRVGDFVGVAGRRGSHCPPYHHGSDFGPLGQPRARSDVSRGQRWWLVDPLVHAGLRLDLREFVGPVPCGLAGWHQTGRVIRLAHRQSVVGARTSREVSHGYGLLRYVGRDGGDR